MRLAAPPVPMRAALAVPAALALLLAGCGTVPSIDDLADEGAVTRHPGAERMTIDAPFDAVWSEVVEVVEQRGYAEVDLEQKEDQEVYRITGERDDRPRDKLYRETVTEHRGRVVATTAEGRWIPLELQEQHEWDMNVVARLDAASGGDERYRLEHAGVEIRIGRAAGAELDREELRAVFDAIHARFDGGSA